MFLQRKKEKRGHCFCPPLSRFTSDTGPVTNLTHHPWARPICPAESSLSLTLQHAEARMRKRQTAASHVFFRPYSLIHSVLFPPSLAGPGLIHNTLSAQTIVANNRPIAVQMYMFQRLSGT